MAENQKKINTFPQTVNYLATFHCKTNIIEVFNLVGHLGIARQTDIRLNSAFDLDSYLRFYPPAGGSLDQGPYWDDNARP